MAAKGGPAANGVVMPSAASGKQVVSDATGLLAIPKPVVVKNRNTEAVTKEIAQVVMREVASALAVRRTR